MKIWILTASFGQGHMSAAKALQEKYEESGHTTIIGDVISLRYGVFSKLIYFIFNNIICRNESIYNFLNEFGRNPKENPIGSRRLQKAFRKIKPDVVVSTWSACARMLGPVSVHTVVHITDLGVHSGWVAPHVSGYFVATERVAKKLAMMNVPEDKIHISGIPVKKEFENLLPNTKDNKEVLVIGGGLGIIPWVNALLKDLMKYPDIHISVVAGNNPRLFRLLSRRYPTATIFGYTRKIPDLLAKTDLLVTKPGGVTIFESIYAQTPCLVAYPCYKHEIENAKFIAEEKIGTVVWNGEPLAERVLQCLNDSDKRILFRENMGKLKEQFLKTQQYAVRDLERFAPNKTLSAKAFRYRKVYR